MLKSKKTILLMCLMAAFSFVSVPFAMATDNVIENFPGYSPFCAPYILITYADVDGNPTTGGYDPWGNWTPNETQIILYAYQGDMKVNTAPNSGQILFSHVGSNCGESAWQTKKGRFAIRFVDAMAPGWIWNDESTWQPRRIQEAEFRISHNEQTNYSTYIGPSNPGNVLNPNPILRVQALKEVAGIFETVDSYEQSGALPCCTMTSVDLSDRGGFTELLVTTDFVENTLDNLYLWEYIVPNNPNTLPGYNVTVCGEIWPYSCGTGLCWGNNGIDLGICITFPVVTRAGNTGSARDFGVPGLCPMAPTNFKIEGCNQNCSWTTPLFRWNIGTSAQYAGGATVCIQYAESSCDESNLRLLHQEGDTWKDVTTSVNTTSNTICGHVSALWNPGQGTPGNTSVGTNVDLTIGDAAITFADVTARGNTTVTESSSGPPAPANFQASCAPPVYYNITTTASYSGNILVCLTYDDTVCDESDLHLFHYEGGTWVDVTTFVDTAANVICGETTGLSAFLLASPVAVAEPQAVDNLVTVGMERSAFDRRTGQFSVDVKIKNTSTTEIGQPVWLVIDGISNPGVTLASPDGTTADGKTYINLSGLLGDGKLSPGETISKRIYFNNPSRLKFTFTPSVRGMVLEGPS